MKNNWIENQISLIGSEKSYFSHVPKNIGKITYCDTSDLDEKSIASNKKNKNALIIVVLAMCLLLAIWTLEKHFVYQIFGTITVTIITAILLNWIFKDVTDYFIGELGFCIIKWNTGKTKVKSEETFFFDDISLCFLGESDVYKEGHLSNEYDYSDFTLSLYKETEGCFVNLLSMSGSYKRESNEDPDDLWMFVEYNFAKKIAYIAGQKKLLKDPVFAVLKNSVKHSKLGHIVLKHVTATGHTMKKIEKTSLIEVSLEGDDLFVGNDVYNKNNCDITLKQGWLVINNKESHDSVYIEFSAISHNKAFLSML